ncbi:MAG: molybdopterin dinucleotide binding domain-containing protein, partial [Gammaproteobacteria bacterium]
GRLLVVDPRRTETAALADLHYPIRPAGDAWLLIALLNLAWQAGRAPPAGLALHGLSALRAACAPVTLADAAAGSGLSAESIVALAEQLLAARSPSVYGRVGTTLQRFGTLTSFLIDALNLVLGGLDAPGGAMFPEQPFASPGRAPGALPYGRYRSRVSGYPELLGQLPAACLAEEMEQPGAGQIRALVTVAGNPVASNPDSARLARAIEGLDFRLAIDIYLTETSARADVVLPGTSPFEDGHYDSFLGGMSWRNTARYSPPLFPLADRPDEWRLMLGVAYAARAGRSASDAELDTFEDETVAGLVEAWRHAPDSPIADRDLSSILAAIGPARGVERILDLGIRAGRWGDHFGRRPFQIGSGVVPTGLTLARLIEHPDSIDLGPLEPGLSRVIGHADGRVDCAPALILAEIERLRASGDRADTGGPAADPDTLLLIGRRNVQTNNSWLHNLPVLARGPNRCVLEMHPQDAARRGLVDGERVTVSTAVDAVTVPLCITDDLRPGVVCLPHGFSAGDWQHLAGVAAAPHHPDGQRHASARARQAGSANANALAAAGDVDLPSATAALNGIPVHCTRAASTPGAVQPATDEVHGS